MPEEPAKSFIFGPYCLDLDQPALLRDGKAVKLAPKAMAILCLLVENHGNLVERQDLLQKVWPNVFVEEANLTVNVFALRKILAEGLDGVSPIETIPKRGYRFTAEVRPAEEPLASVPSAKRSSPPEDERAPTAGSRYADASTANKNISSKGLHGKSLLVYIGIAVLACIVGLGLFLVIRNAGRHANAGRVSLVVLPFKNLTGNPASEYVPDSFTDELITRLAHDYGREFTIVGQHTAMSFKGSKMTLPRIAAELGVQYVIEGSVRSEGTHVRVTVSLVQASNHASLWAESYDGDAGHLLQFEDKVASSVGKELSVRLRMSQKP